MDDLLSEKEQLEQFRSWWSEYGAFVIGGIVMGAGLLFGINYYQSTKLQAQLDASTAYETLVVHLVDGELDEAEAIASEIATSVRRYDLCRSVRTCDGALVYGQESRPGCGGRTAGASSKATQMNR